MNLDKTLETIEKESVEFRKRLYQKGVPVTDIEVDLDDVRLCEPAVHLHLELDGNWFYKQIEKEAL